MEAEAPVIAIIDEFQESENIYKFLSEIFSDADPHFLQEMSSTYSLNSKGLSEVIENLLKTKDYPKKLEKLPSDEAQPDFDNSYRNSVEEFVEKFKDPLTYFTERKVGQYFIGFSKLYLKERFKLMGIRVIDKVLKQNSGNLTLSVHVLLNLKSDRVTKRTKSEIQPYTNCPDERFHDEVYFLENQEAILNCLAEKTKLLQFRIDEARINSEFLECQCCFDDEVLNLDIVACNEGHVFCQNCVKRSVEIAHGDGKIKFGCLIECDSYFNENVLEAILPKPLFKKIQLKIQESEVKLADINGICFCPYCEYAEIPPDDERVFHCQMCKKESCRFCQEANHIPLSCDEYKEDKLKTSARALIEAKMTEALIRECYRCKAKFIKLDGCNKMTCVCGALMCYVCRQPVQNYSHFYDARAPSTSNAENKCPLWSNNSALHVDAVVEAAANASAEIEKKNPELHFDTKELIKGLKRKL